MNDRIIPSGKTDEQVDAIMATIDPESQQRWCGGEYGACACMGCVQVWNRAIMVKEHTGRKFRGDPEHIAEHRIPYEIYAKYKITREEWEAWMTRHGYADS